MFDKPKPISTAEYLKSSSESMEVQIDSAPDLMSPDDFEKYMEGCALYTGGSRRSKDVKMIVFDTGDGRELIEKIKKWKK